MPAPSSSRIRAVLQRLEGPPGPRMEVCIPNLRPPWNGVGNGRRNPGEPTMNTAAGVFHGDQPPPHCDHDGSQPLSAYCGTSGMYCGTNVGVGGVYAAMAATCRRENSASY